MVTVLIMHFPSFRYGTCKVHHSNWVKKNREISENFSSLMEGCVRITYESESPNYTNIVRYQILIHPENSQVTTDNDASAGPKHRDANLIMCNLRNLKG
jgi:hypothetical protein